MSASHDAAPAHGASDYHASRRTYLIGFLMSVVLTAVPFWMVMTGAAAPQFTAIVVVAFAVVQIIVHTVCFLHVNTRSESGWTLMAYVFTAVIILIVIAGSLWIMTHINANMMPMAEMSAN
ncbi:MAG: cytochrome o ubiquinol oxidase subunit IV [Sphingomonadales bacterium]|nr:MAG: cytochrome o ubiquinol oxidase subunit IV [Sphingomonadales bacterium]